MQPGCLERPAIVRVGVTACPDHRSDGRPIARRWPIPAGRPAATRLAWVDSFDGRDRPRGRRRPTARGPAVVVTADSGAGRRLVLGERRRSWWWSPATAACSRSRADGGVARDAHPRRPGGRARGLGARSRSRARSNATTRATSRSCRSTVRRGRCASRTPTTRGTRRGRPTARCSPGTSGTSPTCRGTRHGS